MKYFIVIPLAILLSFIALLTDANSPADCAGGRVQGAL
jgi:hypothetical protein